MILLLLHTWKKAAALLLAAVLLLGAVPALAADVTAEPAEERPAVKLMSYADALTYFDFDKAAYNWCVNYGWTVDDDNLDKALTAILSGTNRELIRGLATLARDTGHGNEKLVVSNGFRPASYQEIIGLHDSNGNIGPFRNYLQWNGKSVTEFWWKAEEQPGWPEKYTIDFEGCDVDTLSVRYFYRAALRLWENGWASNYFAKPGCSAHNSGCAIDVTTYWIGANFDTEYEYKGQVYRLEDYGLYKPLQPGPGTAGETWHITTSPDIYALGNYDNAFLNEYEIVYGLYYSPPARGWSMTGGRGLYIGAGVAVLQIQLYRKGFLDRKYITGFFCRETDRAMRRFQDSVKLGADGVCGASTITQLMTGGSVVKDSIPPLMTMAEVSSVRRNGFVLSVNAVDDGTVSAYKVETRPEGSETWTTRFYNARRDGSGALDVDIWSEGYYDARVSALDAAGNESEAVPINTTYVDATEPRLRRVTLSDFTSEGFTVTCRATDNAKLAGFTVTLTPEEGEAQERFLTCGADGIASFTAAGMERGRWRVSVVAVDAAGNTASYHFTRVIDTDEMTSGETVTYFCPARG